MCASIIAQEKININFKILGIPDEYMINGSQSEVLDYYDMEPKKLSRLAKIMIDK
jgi:transketolase